MCFYNYIFESNILKYFYLTNNVFKLCTYQHFNWYFLFSLLQAVLGNLTISDASLSQESVKMMRLAEKLAQALLEYVRVSEKMYSYGNLRTTVAAINLTKCFKTHLWENSEYVSKQLPKIGPVYSRLLVSKNKTSIDALQQTDPREIEKVSFKKLKYVHVQYFLQPSSSCIRRFCFRFNF